MIEATIIPTNTGGGRASTNDRFIPINTQIGIRGTNVPVEIPAAACLPVVVREACRININLLGEWQWHLPTSY